MKTQLCNCSLLILLLLFSPLWALTGSAGRTAMKDLWKSVHPVDGDAAFIPLERVSVRLVNADTTLLTDEHGRFTFSEKVSSKAIHSRRSNHSFVPRGNSFILNLAENRDVNIELFTVSGKRVYEHNQNLNSGETVISPGPLAAGIYIARIFLGSEMYQQRFVRTNSVWKGERARATKPVEVYTSRSAFEEIIDTAIFSYPGMVNKVVPLSSYDMSLDSIAFDAVYSFAPFEVGYIWKYHLSEPYDLREKEVVFEISRIDTLGDTIAVYFKDDTIPTISVNGAPFTNQRLDYYERKPLSPLNPLFCQRVSIKKCHSLYYDENGYQRFTYQKLDRDTYQGGLASYEYEYSLIQDVGLINYEFYYLDDSSDWIVEYEKRQKLIYYNGLFEFDAEVDTLPDMR